MTGASRVPLVGRAIFAALATIAALAGCNEKSNVEKTIAANQQVNEAQEAEERAEKAEELKLYTARNWRVVAVAQSFAPPGRKRIDALGDEFPWRVDVFEETGDNSYDRLELDSDRDGEFDETWRFRNDRWEKFGGRLFWSGRTWVQTGKGEVALPDVSTVTAGGEALFKVAVEMLQHKAANYEVEDFFAGKGPKVSLHDDDWDARWDRATIDADRDGTIDEKWSRKADALTREVLADKRTFRWRDGRWVRR